MKNSAKTILLLLASAATGIAIGMLIAPEKGVETRRKLLNRGRRLAEGVKQIAGLQAMKYYQWRKDKQSRPEYLTDGDGNPLGMA